MSENEHNQGATGHSETVTGVANMAMTEGNIRAVLLFLLKAEESQDKLNRHFAEAIMGLGGEL